MKTLISIVGTTGIGKTKLSIDLANYYKTEIISCDSRQFFSEMKIGTATPTPEELASVKHHFIGQLSVSDYYSLGQYEKDALKKLDELFLKNEVVVLVGGSMMYEKALIEGLNNLPEANDDNQKKLTQILKDQGIEALQDLLKNLDPAYYAKVDLENPRRLLRAIDVIWQTNLKYSDIISQPKSKRNFNTYRIGIEAPREIIYEKINLRVDKMLAEGLLNEVKSLDKFRETENKNSTNTSNFIPLQTVGYTELFKYIDGIWDLDFAVSEIKKNSRRFAKRQLTWYRKEDNINWVDYKNPFEESLSLLKENL